MKDMGHVGECFRRNTLKSVDEDLAGWIAGVTLEDEMR